MNVWRPATQDCNLPVYFWIHGGSNCTGTAAHPLFHGAKLATRAHAVVVTTNYRLGPFGWFLHPTLEDGNPLNSSGNYGTMDIIQALKWVQVSIAAFGGDPENVTIAGESAGGLNVCCLLISPAAKGLFHKAISQSGGLDVSGVVHIYSKAEGYANAQKPIDKIISADNTISRPPENLAVYLRSKSAEEIFQGYVPITGGYSKDFLFGAIGDGTVIHSEGADALKDPNKYNQVPTILGTNKEEWKLFMLIFGEYGKMPDSQYQTLALAESLKWRHAGVDELATVMSSHKNQPNVYAYQFNYGAYNEDGFNAWPVEGEWPPHSGKKTNLAVMLGAAHALEIPFFFNNWHNFFFGNYIFNETNPPGYEALSEDMITYLASFMRRGQPRDPGGVKWRPWSNKEGGPKRILLDADATRSIIEMSYQ